MSPGHTIGYINFILQHAAPSRPTHSRGDIIYVPDVMLTLLLLSLEMYWIKQVGGGGQRINFLLKTLNYTGHRYIIKMPLSVGVAVHLITRRFNQNN